MRIIVKGPQGVGKTVIAMSLCSRQRLVMLDEWDGRSQLPDQVVAVTSVDDIRIPAGGVTQVIDVSIHGDRLIESTEQGNGDAQV